MDEMDYSKKQRCIKITKLRAHGAILFNKLPIDHKQNSGYF